MAIKLINRQTGLPVEMEEKEVELLKKHEGKGFETKYKVVSEENTETTTETGDSSKPTKTK